MTRIDRAERAPLLATKTSSRDVEVGAVERESERASGKAGWSRGRALAACGAAALGLACAVGVNVASNGSEGVMLEHADLGGRQPSASMASARQRTPAAQRRAQRVATRKQSRVTARAKLAAADSEKVYEESVRKKFLRRDAVIRSRGEEKIKEVKKDAETLIADIHTRVEQRAKAIEKTAHHEGTASALQQAQRSIDEMRNETEKRVALIKSKTASRIKMIEEVTEKHTSSHASSESLKHSSHSHATATHAVKLGDAENPAASTEDAALAQAQTTTQTTTESPQAQAAHRRDERITALENQAADQTAKVTAVANDVKQQAAKIDNVDNKADEQADDIKKVSKDVKEQEETNEDQSDDVNKVEKTTKSTQDDVDDLSSKQQDQGKKIAQNEASINQLDAQVRADDSKIKEVTDDVEKTDNKIVDVSTKQAAEVRELDDTERRLDNKIDGESKELEETQDQLKDETEKLEDTQDQLKDETKELDDTQSKLQDTTTKLAQASVKEQGDVNKLQDKIDGEDKELDETQSKLENESKELDETQSKLDDESKELGDQSKELDATESKVDSESKELDETQSKLESESKELDATETKLDEETNKLTDATSKHDSAINQLQQRVEEENTELDATQSKLEDETSKLKETVTDHGMQLEKLKLRDDELNDGLKDAQVKFDGETQQLGKRIDEARDELNAATSRIDDETKELKEFSSKNGGRIDEALEAISGNREAMEANREAIKNITEIKDQVRRHADDLVDLDRRLGEEEGQVYNATAELKNLTIKFDEHADAMEEFSENMKLEREKTRELIATIDEKVGKVQESYDDFRQKIEVEMQKLEEKIAKLELSGSVDENKYPAETKQSTPTAENHYPVSTSAPANTPTAKNHYPVSTSAPANTEQTSQLSGPFFDQKFYRMRPEGLEPDFEPKMDDPAAESGGFFACNVPNQCMTGMKMFTRENRLVGLQGLCAGGARSTDLLSGFYDMFPKTSTMNFNKFIESGEGSDRACTMSFGENSGSLFIRRENDYVIAMSQDGTKATRCGRDVETAASVRHQCQNPRACITGFHVKNEYGNLDGNAPKRTENDLAISVVDFVCSDGNFAVDPIKLRPDYGQVKVQPEFTVGVANTPRHDGTMRRTVTPYLRLKTNTVVSDSFLMAVKVRDITDLDVTGGWCTQQTMQASLNSPHTCKEGAKLCAKPSFLYNPAGMEYELKFGEQVFELLDPERHESSRIAIYSEDTSLPDHVKHFPMPKDREFFQFGRKYEVCVAAVERSKFKNLGASTTNGPSSKSFYNRHLDGSAQFIGLQQVGERQLQMQGGPKHFMVKAPKAPLRSRMTELECFSGECDISGFVPPIEDKAIESQSYPARPSYPASHQANADVGELTEEQIEQREATHTLDARHKLEQLLHTGDESNQ